MQYLDIIIPLVGLVFFAWLIYDMVKDGWKGFKNSYMPWIILIVALTVWRNVGFLWALGSWIVMTAMYGWKDRYKGLEHLKEDDNVREARHIQNVEGEKIKEELDIKGKIKFDEQLDYRDDWQKLKDESQEWKEKLKDEDGNIK